MFCVVELNWPSLIADCELMVTQSGEGFNISAPESWSRVNVNFFLVRWIYFWIFMLEWFWLVRTTWSAKRFRMVQALSKSFFKYLFSIVSKFYTPFHFSMCGNVWLLYDNFWFCVFWLYFKFLLRSDSGLLERWNAKRFRMVQALSKSVFKYLFFYCV